MDALKFITCGSVDDGKSTLIGRLLVDTQAVLSDQLAGVQRSGQTDLALLTDGLSAEREQGITIDVAYRYFSTATRKFIIGDAPGHEQYTRNMVTAASTADAAVVLVDATKIDTSTDVVSLLPQTRRHSLLAHRLRVPSLVFAVNKLDAVADAALAFERIREALLAFALGAGFEPRAIVPLSALRGWNVVEPQQGWCGYQGPSLLALLEGLPNIPHDADLPLAFPVQWVEKNHDSAETRTSRRVFWGRLACGTLQVGQTVRVFPSGQTATVARLLDAVRRECMHIEGHSAGVVLDREVDVSRGDWLLAETGLQTRRDIQATVAWMDDSPLQAGRVYWALHGRRWVKARVMAIEHRLDIQTLEPVAAEALQPNEIGLVHLQLQQDIPLLPYAGSRGLGALVLVDTASHRTSAAALIA
ncbi:MAG: GTP-binding protein [Alphaproteobacteria bacterium]|nr:GTP-binding protein [Alphaproteobacteria bacterium]